MLKINGEKRIFYLVTYIYLSAFILLNLGDTYAKFATIFLVLLCLVWVEWSLFKSKEKQWFRLFGSVLLATAMIIYTIVVSQFNTAMNVYFTEKNPDVLDKGRMVLSVTLQMPQHKEMSVKKMNGVEYYYTKSSEEDIEQIDELLKNQKMMWDEWVGETELELAIQFLNNEWIKNQKIERAAYQTLNGTIYVNGKDESLEYIVKHEYTHYRVNGYAPDRVDGEERIPQWFNEGLADTIATGENIVYLETDELTQTVDFDNMNENDDFHRHRIEGNEPYLQSFTVVRNLVNQYGFKQVVNLVKAKNQQEFYKELENLTGLDKKQIQTTYSKKMP